MKTSLVAAIVAAFAITSGIFSIAGPAQAQTNSSDRYCNVRYVDADGRRRHDDDEYVP